MHKLLETVVQTAAPGVSRGVSVSAWAAAFATLWLTPAVPLQAASVTWETPVTVTNVSDIDLTGTLVHAGSWGTTNLSVDVAGETVPFEDRPVNTTDGEAGVMSTDEYDAAYAAFFTNDTGSANFNEILDSVAGGGTKVLTLEDLVPGAAYRAQLFVCDQRAGIGDRTQKWSDNAVDGAGNESATFARNQVTHTIGTFTADASSQVLYGLPVNDPATIVNAYVLRKTADAAPGIFLDPPSGSVMEGYDTHSYRLRTATPPASNITVSATAPAGLEVSTNGIAFSSSVAVPFAGGAMSVTVFYRAQDDDRVELVETLDIAHAVTVGDGGDYPTSLAIDPFTATVSDGPLANVGDMAVYNNAGAVARTLTAENGATPSLVNEFTTTVAAPMSSYALEADGRGVRLSAGRHLVLYNTRVDHVSGNFRAEMVTHLSLESAAGTNVFPYGRAQGYIRTDHGSEEVVISGGAIVAAGSNSVLRLHTARTDLNGAKTMQVEPGHTAIQLLKLDDTLDYLRVMQSSNTLGAVDTNFVPVAYDTVDEASAGAMSFSAGTGAVTLNDAGHYLVLANTHLKRTDSREFSGTASSTTRGGYTQRLTLNGVPLEGSLTTTYTRGTQEGEEADDGTLTIGMLVEASATNLLSVEQMKESGATNNIIGGKTALAIVKLPDLCDTIRLQDTTGQDINPGADGGDGSPPVPMTFATQLGAPAAVFTHAVSNSAVTVNADGPYLFLGAFFCDDDTNLRQVPNQQWSVNGTTLAYGESSQYSRNENIFNNGNWSGFMADLSAGDAVEMTSRRLANAGGMPGHSLGLQGAAVRSLTTNPVLVTNERLGVTAGSSETITSNFLLTVDADTSAAGLAYTVDSIPTGGTLRSGMTDLWLNDTFTQADIGGGNLSFTAGSTTGEQFGFSFSVSDGEGQSSAGFFNVKVVPTIVPGGESVACNEDALVTNLAGGVDSLLANDTGEALTVTAHDAISAQGAAVNVAAAGTFSYDPSVSIALQGLGMTRSGTNDTFTYTVTDAIGKTAVGTVTVLVSGVEDTFAAVDNHLDDPALQETAAHSFTADLTDNDGIVRTANGDTNDVLVLNYDASASAGTGLWENLGSLGGAAMNWILGQGVSLNAVAGSRAGIKAAYAWDGSSAATAILNSGGESIHDILGNGTIDQGSASFEFWVRPSAAALSQNSTLFETGGGSGAGIVIGSNGVLRAANNLLVGEVAYDLLTDNLGLVGGNPTGEFFHVVFVSDFDIDLSSLYVNGTLVDTAANTATDWDGGDNAGLGHFQGANHGGFMNAAAGTEYDTYFNGELAAFRVYNEALTLAEVFQNYRAIAEGGVDIEGDALVVSGVYDAGTNLVGGTGTKVTLPSGAAVTLDAISGSFTYDPAGIPGIDGIPAGGTQTDSFDIRVIDGKGQADDATVTVTIHGVTRASNDVVEARELLVTTFTAGELVANDEDPPVTANPYIELVANDVTVSNEADGAWINTGSSGGTHNATVREGTLVNARSAFGGIGKAWRDLQASAATLDDISQADTTFEIWFKPRFGSGEKQVLFETGGNVNGSSIVFDPSTRGVVWTIDCGDDTNPVVQLLAEAPGVSYDNFNHLVAVYDRDNPTPQDILEIYLNNDPTAPFDATPAAAVTNAAGGVNDYAGTDATGIGTVSGTAARDEMPAPLDGLIAAVRVYNRALNVTEIEANFNWAAQSIQAIAPVPPTTTALGATLALNSDGSVSYDASSLSTNIPAGQVAQDTFTYTIDNGAGGVGLAIVTVSVAGVGGFLAVDDVVTANEDGPAIVFDPTTNDFGVAGATVVVQSVVASLVADFETGTTVGQTADFSATSGWRYLWNAPTDWDGSGSLDATNGAFGTAANYRLLKWTGNFWSADGDELNTNGSPSEWLKLGSGGTGHPGLGSTDDGGVTNTLPRGPIAAYTVSAGGAYGIVDSFLARNEAAGDSISAIVYVNDTLMKTVTVAPATSEAFDVELGQLTAGDTVYVAVSPDATAGNDTFNWDFSIVKSAGAGLELEATIGTVSTDGSTITYDPGGAFELMAVGQTVFDTFAYTIRDGSNVSHATVTVAVGGANDVPTGVDDTNSTDEDSTVAGTVTNNDTDGDQGDALLGFGVAEVQGAAGNVGTATATDRGGSVTLQADGSYVYDPNGQFENLGVGQADTDTFTYLVMDAHGLTGTVAATVTITIDGADDGVVATENDYELKADEIVSGNVIADDTGNGVDESIDDNDTLSIAAIDASSVQGLLTLGAPAVIGTRGRTNLTDAVQTIEFDSVGGRFSNPVVFANPPTDNEAEPCVVMVSNVTATTFDVWLKEQPENNPPTGTNDMDGAAHTNESLSWFVFETGQYQLLDGRLLEVGTVETSAIQQDGGATAWETVSFTVSFSNAPAVFNQIQTYSGNTNEKAELFGTRMNGLATTNSFQVALEDYEGDTAARTTNETIGWLAVEPGSGTWDGNPVDAGITADAVEHTFYTINFAGNYSSAPDFLATLATFDGPDPGHLRHRNLNASSVQIRVGEDRFNDAETTHADERVAYLAVGGSGELTAYPAGTVQGAFTYDPNGAFNHLRYGQTALEIFTYTVSDGRGNTDTKTVTITVRDLLGGTLILVR